MTPTTVKPVASIESLPHDLFGPRNITWWGALAGEFIEGFVIVLGIFAYFYLRYHASGWPPPHTPQPSLGVPALNLALMALSVGAARWVGRAAKRLDRGAALPGLVIHSILGLAILVVRYFEMRALNVRWDTNAYGSIAWGLLFTHGYLIFLDVLDTLGLTLLFARLEPADKHYVDAADNSFYWYFVVVSWIPVFITVFLSPRI
jgi:heme/copper-type cytochrome/quinol oxidase subunit 3